MLYDDYLGTGSGLKELGILYDEDYELDEYELLAVLNNKDWADGNMLLVIAQPEDNGSYAQHSLMLSGLQLARLWQEKQIQWIEMRSGEAGVLLRIDELLSGNVAKYVDWALRDPEAAKPEAVENLPEVELTAVQLEHVRFEVRIEPGEEGTYRFGVYVWFAGDVISEGVPERRRTGRRSGTQCVRRGACVERDGRNGRSRISGERTHRDAGA